MTAPPQIAALLAARRLERVPADRPNAELRLARAEEKFQAAGKIAAIDLEVAYVTAYDAMRIQRIRRRRNKAEYDDITIGQADLTADLAHAEAVIRAVRAAL